MSCNVTSFDFNSNAHQNLGSIQTFSKNSDLCSLLVPSHDPTYLWITWKEGTNQMIGSIPLDSNGVYIKNDAQNNQLHVGHFVNSSCTSPSQYPQRIYSFWVNAKDGIGIGDLMNMREYVSVDLNQCVAQLSSNSDSHLILDIWQNGGYCEFNASSC